MGNLTPTQLIIQISIALILGGSLAYLLWKQRQQAKQISEKKPKAERITNVKRDAQRKQGLARSAFLLIFASQFM